MIFAPLLLVAAQASGAPAPIAHALGSEIQAMRDHARGEGDALWPGYGDTPFGLLLIEHDGETLFCSARVPEGFGPAEREVATGCDIHRRPRSQLDERLLAAMPLFGPPTVIVIGTPEATGQTPARWRSAILHEHMHQWQWSLPRHYERVAALDLADGDETGMWMLNFPFPYQDPDVAPAAIEASRALAGAVEARDQAGFGPAFARYMAARRAFAVAAGARNWRYFELQLWQEGVARWTEIALARRTSDPDMRADAGRREREMLEALAQADPSGLRREMAYSYGAAEAMLLEACGPEWRQDYPVLLALGPLIEAAAQRCAEPPHQANISS